MTDESTSERDTKSYPSLVEWKFTTTTQDGWKAMVEGIRHAEISIDFEQFNLYPDTIGKQFIDALIERAQKGVKVRLLVDSMGSILLGKSEFPEVMTKAGIQLRFFNWITPFSKGNKRIWFFRDHRRALVIDEKTVFIGGICIGDEMKDWRDTVLETTTAPDIASDEANPEAYPSIVKQIQTAFEATWKKAHKQSLRINVAPFKCDPKGFNFLTHAPLPRQRYLYYRLIEMMRAATRTIFITTPYFLPDHKLFRVLILARRRGVDVRLLVPDHSDHPVVDLGAHSYFHTLLKHKIRIYRYNKMIHSKTVTIDSDSALIGSMNMDNVSLRYNFESGILATNTQFAKELEEHFMEDLQNAKELTLEEWKSRSFMTKLLEWCVWPIRKVL